MEATVFFSWQSDLSRKYTKMIIHDAIEEALVLINADEVLDEATRIDHDTLGISGAPEIAATIIRKIRSCSVFVADLSFVGENTKKADGRSQKLLPNPNVLLELGFAALVLGWERIILVMNTEYGIPDELIFDLKHRRYPITFKVGPKNKDRLESIQHKLAKDISEAIKAALATKYESVKEAVDKLDTHCLRWMSDLGREDLFHVPERKTMAELVGNQRLDDALPRLLSLGLLRCDIAYKGELYAYHWTHLGKQVLISLGLRDRPRKPAPDPFTFALDTWWDRFYDPHSEAD